MNVAGWREFICSSRHAGRHLAPLGRRSSFASATPIDRAELQHFLDRLGDKPGRVAILVDAIDLLTGGYSDFFSSKAGIAAQRLAVENHRAKIVVGPSIRGNVDWGRTALDRAGGRISQAQFISSVPYRSHDLSINRVFRWLIEDSLGALAHIEKRVGWAGLPDALQKLKANTESTLQLSALGDVGASKRISHDLAMSKPFRRDRLLGAVHELASRRQRLTTSDYERRWDSIISLLSVQWLEPLSPDDLYELFVLVQVLDVIEHDLGFGAPSELDLIMPGRRAVARFERDDAVVDVLFDQSPPIPEDAETEYSRAASLQPWLSNVPRRPDVTVIKSDGREVSSVTFVEAKNSESREYLSESVYKCFGYLHDYGPCYREAGISLKCILSCPEHGGRIESANDFALVRSDDRDLLSEMLSSQLQ